MSYLNVDFDFFDHPKTRRLRALLGSGAETTIMRIWAHCGKFHPDDGVLSGYSIAELEEVCGWRGEPGKALEALLSVRFLEQCSSNAIASCSSNATALQVHDWSDHQGHISMLKGRAKAAAAARWGKAPKKDAQAMLKQCSSNASSNAPSVPFQSIPEREGGNSLTPQEAHIPTEKEFCDRFMTVGIPADYLLEKWTWFQGNNEWLDRFGRLKDYFTLVNGWWKKDRENWTPNLGNGTSRRAPFISDLRTLITAKKDHVTGLRTKYATETDPGRFKWPPNSPHKAECIAMESEIEQLEAKLAKMTV